MSSRTTQSQGECFRPPYCPSDRCRRHLAPRGRWWKRAGFYPVCGGVRRQRFQCKECGRTFCSRIFGLNYRVRTPESLNARIWNLVTEGVNLSRTAHRLGISEHLVRTRKARMTEEALYRHLEILGNHRIGEPIVFDGLENFAGSQFEPNNINQFLGKKSLFTYHFNFFPMNRKGRMSPVQLHENSRLQAEQGKFPGNAARTSVAEALREILRRTDPDQKEVLLYSDDHFQYRRAIQRDIKDPRIHHVRISSKRVRSFKNHLFPVNHADLKIRKESAAFARETISFSKTHVAMIQSFVLFFVNKNYLAPQMTKKVKLRPRAHLESPAQAVGLTDKVLTFAEFFSRRTPKKAIPLPREWKLYLEGRQPYSRQPLAA